MSQSYEPKTEFSRAIDRFEQSVIALLLASMTAITFINVVLRKGFNSGWLWGAEATGFLFAWLVIFGLSYCVKVGAHLGVDAMINLFAKPFRKFLAIVAGLCCILYAALLLKGGWDYWANFANLPQTTGHWFPTGFEDKFLGKSWYEVNDVPMPDFLRFIEPMINENEAYEKIPRFIPYAILPFGIALFMFRLIQAFMLILNNQKENLIASHEVEDQIEDANLRVDGKI